MKTIDKIVADMGRGRFIIWQGGPCRQSGECCEDCSTCRRDDDIDVAAKKRAISEIARFNESDIDVALDRLFV